MEPIKDHKGNLSRWFREFEIKTLDMNDRDRARGFVRFLEGETVINAFSRLDEAKRGDYRAIKEHMTKAFQIRGGTNIREFISIKMGEDEDVIQFADRLKDLAERATGSDKMAIDAEITSVFRAGVKSELRLALLNVDEMPFDKLVEKAAELEERVRKSAPYAENVENLNAIGDKTCYKCHKAGHFARKCPENEPTRNYSSAAVSHESNRREKCNFCGRINHKFAECRDFQKMINEALENANKKDSNKPNTSRGRGGNRFNKNQYCSFCKMNNHSDENCRKKKRNGDKPNSEESNSKNVETPAPKREESRTH